MEFLDSRGVNRFHFVGGARFVHGGAMLQEIVVPVITVKQKGKLPRRPRSRPVTCMSLEATTGSRPSATASS